MLPRRPSGFDTEPSIGDLSPTAFHCLSPVRLPPTTVMPQQHSPYNDLSPLRYTGPRLFTATPVPSTGSLPTSVVMIAQCSVLGPEYYTSHYWWGSSSRIPFRVCSPAPHSAPMDMGQIPQEIDLKTQICKKTSTGSAIREQGQQRWAEGV